MTNQNKELYQQITDICFEEGQVTKPMVDRLYALIAQSNKEMLDEIESKIMDIIANNSVLVKNQTDPSQNKVHRNPDIADQVKQLLLDIRGKL